jgi:cysteine desulfurase / selenocysteine lyase
LVCAKDGDRLMSSTHQTAGLDVERIRRDFPILATRVGDKPLVYLDNAATSQKPAQVLDALNAYWTEANANVHRGVHHLSQKATVQFDSARETVRRFINAIVPEEVIFTKGCTEGINLVAQCLRNSTHERYRLGEGDEILLSEMEHHSNIVPWQMVAEQVGAKVRVIPISDRGEILLEEYEGMLSDRTRVVGIVHVSNSLGTVNPVSEMAKLAHRAGALVVVDGAQAGPHHRVDVQEIDADFYTLSCHKIYAPTGVGVLYGKKEILEALPPYLGGGDMVRTVSFEKTTYADLPNKYEAGTPNIAGVIGLGAAIEYLASLAPKPAPRVEPQSYLSLDAMRAHMKALETEMQHLGTIAQGPGDLDPLSAAMRAVESHERELMRHASEALSQIPGVRLIGTAPEKVGIVSFVMEGAHPHDIGTILDGEGVAIRAGHHCCMPLMKRFGVPATARASFALYNTFAEVDALVRGVQRVKELFS